MFCVNLPINTNFFDNNSITTFTQACNKASETLKSNLVSKYQNLHFENLRKFNDLDLTKSKSDTNLSNTNTSAPNADPSYSVITTTTTPSLISKFINSDKKEMVHEMIENLNINLKKTKSFVEQKVQIMLESLEQPQEPFFDKSTAQIIDEFCDVSSIEDNIWYESDEESIFESPAHTPKETYCNKNTWEEVYANIPSHNISLAKKFKEQIEAEFTEFVHVNYEKPIVIYRIWEEPVVAQFIGMTEEKARKEALNAPNFDNISYISKFFQMVEQDQSPQKTSIYDTSEFFKMIQRHKPLEDVTIYNTSYVLEFFRMIEKDYYSPRAPKVDATNYVSAFFKMTESKQDSKESNTAVKFVTMDYFWLKMYEILTKSSGDTILKLFKLSQLKIKNSKKENLKVSLIETTQKASEKKKISYYSSCKNPRRFRNSNFH